MVISFSLLVPDGYWVHNVPVGTACRSAQPALTKEAVPVVQKRNLVTLTVFGALFAASVGIP